YIFFLNSDGTVKSQHKISDTAAPWRGPFFGQAVANLGDLDGDEITDLGIGAPLAAGYGSNRGAAYILYMNANGTVKAQQAIIDTEGAPYDLGQTFFLNSLPGAKHTIYLDFDGHTTTGTSWNSAYTGGAPIVTPALDLDGVPTSFNEYELARIQRIWQRVTEDFLPFNVNVTTQDPGLEALVKTSQTGGGKNKPPADTEWGVRIVIGGSSMDWFGSGAGGVAYIGSFNASTDTPAFVFQAELLSGEKAIAEAASHEAGHTLGLTHDGRVTPSEAYYQGHGSGATGWAPIMGVGYYRELTQWSKGQYASANNTQDDLAIITTNNGFSYRADDRGNTAGTATALTVTGTAVAGAGIIERNTDSDWFSFTATTNAILDMAINPAERGANLDILARLYDATSTLIATSNPLDGLGGMFQMVLTAGTYYLSITGTGKGDPLVDGYTNYASLGQYFVSGTVSAAAPNTPPIAEAGGPVSGSEDAAITFDASGSFDADGDALTYTWDFGDGNTLTTSSPTVNHTYLWGGAFNVTLTVQDPWGGSSSDTTTASISEVNDAPLANTGGTYSGVTGSAVSFSAAASSDFDNLDGSAANDQTLVYTWDFGDGNTATGVNVSHTYAAAGNYVVTLTVSDGVDSQTATTSAGITNPPAGSANDLYVWDIAFGARTRGKNQDLRVLVTIRRDSDADGIAEATDALVSGAAVTVVITGPKGGTFSGTTSSTGVFTSSWLTNVSPGLYTADVTSVTQSGRTWNPSLDVESIEQYSVSAAAVNGRFVVPNGSAAANGLGRPADDPEEDDTVIPLFSLLA
ncbi:MAG: PKD domain-containing protein, partial [Planctomycetaceae bacterium]